MDCKEVILTREQLLEAYACAAERDFSSFQKGLKDQHGLDPMFAISVSVNGSCGERAFAVALELPWVPTVDVFKVPDVAEFFVRTAFPRIDRRTGMLLEPDLILRDNDVDGVYALVVGKAPKFKVYGAIKRSAVYSPEGRKEYVEYYQMRGGRERAYFIPASKLKPFSYLQAYVERKKQEGKYE